MLSCPRDARWLLGSSRRRLGWTACRQAGWAFSGAAFCRTPSPARSPPRQVRGGGGPRHTERRWEGGRRSASPRGEGGLSRGREMSSVPPRFGYRLHRPWQLQIHVRKTRIKEAQHLGCTGHHLDTKKFLAFPEHRPCIEKLRSHRLTESTVSVQAVKSVHFKQTGSKSIWWVRELKRESGYWYPSCSVVVSLPLFLFPWETVITAATFACSLVGALSGLKAFPLHMLPACNKLQLSSWIEGIWVIQNDLLPLQTAPCQSCPPLSPLLPLFLYSATHPAPLGHRAHWRVLSTLCWQTGKQQTQVCPLLLPLHISSCCLCLSVTLTALYSDSPAFCFTL